ncbi:MAG: hypothetical protein J7K13_04310, partial [Thermoplasmata archaeon]|nr:hypothetical protein [Thermoplasmata archaeon]
RSDGSRNNSLFDNIICGNEGVDVEAFDINEKTGNHGKGNTGMTAKNYRDDDTTGDTYFTYPCNHSFKGNGDGDQQNGVSEDKDSQTPGFDLVLLSIAMLFVIILYVYHKKIRGNK